jgi:hypothetical protein
LTLLIERFASAGFERVFFPFQLATSGWSDGHTFIIEV